MKKIVFGIIVFAALNLNNKEVAAQTFKDAGNQPFSFGVSLQAAPSYPNMEDLFVVGLSVYKMGNFSGYNEIDLATSIGFLTGEYKLPGSSGIEPDVTFTNIDFAVGPSFTTDILGKHITPYVALLGVASFQFTTDKSQEDLANDLIDNAELDYAEADGLVFNYDFVIGADLAILNSEFGYMAFSTAYYTGNLDYDRIMIALSIGI